MSDDKKTSYLNLPLSSQAMTHRHPSAGTALLGETWQLAFQFDSTHVIIPVAEQILVGRLVDPDSPVHLDLNDHDGYSGGVSRRHAMISLQNGQLYIEDLGSTNGTRINGAQLTANHKYRLRDGDEVEFARVRVSLRFVKPD